MRDGNIGLLAVQESHLTDEIADQFQELFSNSLTLHYSPDPETRNARGVAIILNKRMVDTRTVKTTVVAQGRALMASIPWHNDQHINVLTVYAPNPPRENKHFWVDILSELTSSPNLHPDIVLGDFNIVEDALDRLPCKPDAANATSALRDLVGRFELVDGWRRANPESKGYTWSRESDGTQSRIDRIYIREEFFADCKDWDVSQPPIPTDHDLVSARIATPSTPETGRGRWAIPSRLFKAKPIKEEIQRLGLELETRIATTRRSPRSNPQTWLREFKTKATDFIRSYEKRTQPAIKIKIAKLQERLHEVRNDERLPTEEVRIATTQIKKEIQLLVKGTHQYGRDRVAAIDAAEGEVIGKTWSRRAKINTPRDTIKALKDPVPNTTTRDSRRMAQIAAEHHENLQHQGHNPHDPPNKRDLDEILSHIRTKVSEANKIALSENTSEKEIRNAMRKTANDKAPGLDGIPIELWRSMDDCFRAAKSDDPEKRRCNIVQILTRVFQDVEEFGMDANARLNEGCMSPIYKKKDPESIENYRPITLLNTDYKIFTKALSTKLADVAPQIINRDQAGFIPGRSIFDQVKTTKLVTDYMNSVSRTGAIVALDQEKAYDKILHPYLWEVMRKLEFPEKFIRKVQYLYDNAATTVMINGEMSIPFIVRRGVMQGDTLSCLLFDIAIEPLAELIRRSTHLRGIQIPGTRKFLKVKLFADDTTVFLANGDNIEDLQRILDRWCSVSGARFNIEKTEIIPLGNATQRSNILTSRKLNEACTAIPDHIHIARDGEPVRILGAWLGNSIDQAVTWAPIVENCTKRLKRWGAARHTLEGRRLIVQMQIAGVTQYLTKVQGMPREVEVALDKEVRRFIWNNDKSDTVNRKQMHATHKQGGKKVLNLEARNRAVHLTWLKAYLNLDEDRATWAYFADAIICKDIPDSLQIDQDPGSRIMPVLQTWHTRSRMSTLPVDLREMLKLVKEFNVKIDTPNPSREAKLSLPLWYHVHSTPAARKLYKKKTAKCLRKKHDTRLVRDAVNLIQGVNADHLPARNCKCNTCRSMRTSEKCTHPHECINMAATLLREIHPRWNPDKEDNDNQTTRTPPPPQSQEEEDDIVFDVGEGSTSLRDSVMIFGKPTVTTASTQGATIRTAAPPNRPTTVYTDGACMNNGDENASAGIGVWYGDEDPRNLSMRVPIAAQSNQTGELMAVLMATRNHPLNEDLRILSDSRYVIDGLTKNRSRWESRNWIDTHHGDIFKCITAWMRWRTGKTSLKWVKGHSGIKGNEEADKLADAGSRLPLEAAQDALSLPQDQPSAGASIARLAQRDFYRIINDKTRIPTRSRTERNLEAIKSRAKETFGIAPTSESIWMATKHKDLSRKTRDFLWKATQNAYKIGEFWLPIAGFEERATCPLCDEIEDLGHILTNCSSRARSTAWDLANEVWKKRYTTDLPTNLGDVLGCGLAKFTRNGKPDKGKNRLYRILMSETAYLIWKLRNERRIRDSDTVTTSITDTVKRWTNTINKRLTIDRFLMDNKRFGKRALSPKLVKDTWRYCLMDEEALPKDWQLIRGVLVGISLARPSGRYG